jgi:hypothetical protein
MKNMKHHATNSNKQSATHEQHNTKVALQQTTNGNGHTTLHKQRTRKHMQQQKTRTKVIVCFLPQGGLVG